MAKLDRFYVYFSRNGSPGNHVRCYNIDGSCGFSDHLPVSCSLVIKESRPAGARYKMNAACLTDPLIREELQRFWGESSHTMGFPSKLRRILKWYKEMCISRAKFRRERETSLKNRLRAAREELHAAPGCETAAGKQRK